MGASKQLSTYLKTKIIHYYELGEGYMKLSGRFGLSISSQKCSGEMEGHRNSPCEGKMW